MIAVRAMLGRHGARIAALGMVLALYGLTRLPEASESERLALASRFAFVRATLPELPGPRPRSVRAVHPSLERISAWISSVGASVALSDLDGDGLPNDACHVDPRTDQIIVAPVPGTGERYAAFELRPSPLPYDPSTRPRWDACLPGDLNEDGRLDVVVDYWGRTPVAFLRASREMEPDAYVPREVVAGGERWYSNAATLADLDGDGHVDLIVGNYSPDGAQILDAGADGVERMQHSMSRAANGGGPRFLLWKGATSGGAVRLLRGGPRGRGRRGWPAAGPWPSVPPTSTATSGPRSTSRTTSVPTGSCTTARSPAGSASRSSRGGGR